MPRKCIYYSYLSIEFLLSQWWMVKLGNVGRLYCNVWRWITNTHALLH